MKAIRQESSYSKNIIFCYLQACKRLEKAHHIRQRICFTQSTDSYVNLIQNTSSLETCRNMFDQMTCSPMAQSDWYIKLISILIQEVLQNIQDYDPHVKSTEGKFIETESRIVEAKGQWGRKMGCLCYKDRVAVGVMKTFRRWIVMIITEQYPCTWCHWAA